MAAPQTEKNHREEKHHQAKTPLHKKHQREQRRRKTRVLESLGDIETQRKKNRKLDNTKEEQKPTTTKGLRNTRRNAARKPGAG